MPRAQNRKSTKPPEQRKTVAVTMHEGGYWIEFEEFQAVKARLGLERTIHSILFEDGSVWDCVNEWRNEKHDVDFVLQFIKMRKETANQGE